MIGNRWSTIIMSLSIKLDKLYSQNSKAKREEKRKLKPMILKLRKRISNLKTEMRNQSANFLVKRYDLIVMPK